MLDQLKKERFPDSFIAATGSSDIRYGDVTDAETMRDIIDGHHTVVHAAALHGKHVREHDSQKFLQVNVQGTANVLDACVAAGIPHVVLMSSTSVYGLSAALPFRETTWVDEDLPCQPRDINDLCKVLCEQVAEYAVRRHGLSVTVLRSGRFFVGDWLDFNMAKLAGAVDEGDVAQAIVRALLKRPPGLRTYCISSLARFARDDLPLLSWAADRLIEERYPGSTEALAAARRRVPVRLHRVVDISRARDELGYEPSGNFDSFVAQLLAEPSPMVLLGAAARWAVGYDNGPVLVRRQRPDAGELWIRGEPNGMVSLLAEDTPLLDPAPDALPRSLAAVESACTRLLSQAEVVVIEGSGSCTDLVGSVDVANDCAAQCSDARVILVAGASAGGAIACLRGSLVEMSDQMRSRLLGIALNDVRGGDALLEKRAIRLADEFAVTYLGALPHCPIYDNIPEGEHSALSDDEAEYDFLAGFFAKHCDVTTLRHALSSNPDV